MLNTLFSVKGKLVCKLEFKALSLVELRVVAWGDSFERHRRLAH